MSLTSQSRRRFLSALGASAASLPLLSLPGFVQAATDNSKSIQTLDDFALTVRYFLLLVSLETLEHPENALCTLVATAVGKLRMSGEPPEHIVSSIMASWVAAREPAMMVRMLSLLR